MKKHKSVKKSTIEIIILVSFLIICSIIVGLNRIELSNFNPINGDFQNYNPVRRFLAGQIPYKDFAVYLGTGHLMVLSAIQLIIGNGFTKSLFASNVVTMLFFELIIFAVSFFMLKDKRKALYVSLGFTIVNLMRPRWLLYLFDKVFIGALDFGMKPGNSARLIRIAIMPCLMIIFYLGYKFFKNTKNQFILKHKNILAKIAVAFVSGIAILWSNDGGIATYITVSFIYFLLLIKEHKKNIKYILRDTFMYIGVSVLAFFIVLAIVTRGNVMSWFEFTLGVSSYQNWYYLEAVDKLNISIYDIDLSLYNVLMIAIAIYYIYKIFKSKDSADTMRYSILNIAIISSILSTYLYQLLSGGKSNDVLNLVFLVWIVCTVIQIAQKHIKDQKIYKKIKVVVLVISCATIIGNVSEEMVVFRDRRNYTYIEELGGYFSKLGDSVQDAIEKVGDNKIFSTYATAVEVATNQYQPTGIDYIIHAMGDKQREKYLETFRKGDFKYVTTTDRDYHEYRYWIKNANWFFYRELYKNYVPTFATEYNVFWEKSDKDNSLIDVLNGAKIAVSKKNKSRYTITVETKDTHFNGVADVKLSYNSGKAVRFLKTGAINRYVYVKDTTGNSITSLKCVNYNIPENSDGYYVPITIVNGKGSIEVLSYPMIDNYLNIENAELINVYDVNFKYCVASKKKETSGNLLYIDATEENRVILNGVKSIKIGNIESKVLEYKEEGKYIVLNVEKDAKRFKYPNFFEVIK